MAGENYTAIPTAALMDARLSRLDLRVLLALSSFRNSEHSAVWPSRASVALRAGVHITSVSKSTARLERFGWIKKEGGGGFCQPATYILCVAQGVVPDDERTQRECARRAVLRTRRGQMEARGEWCEGGGNSTPRSGNGIGGGENGTGGHSGNAACGHSDHHYENADHTSSRHNDHRSSGHSGHTLYRVEEQKEEQKEEGERHALRGALPPGVIRADELLNAGNSARQTAPVHAEGAAGAAQEPAGVTNGDEAGQPPAERKKRAQRPEDWAGVHVERPDGVAEQVWADFCRLRRAKHAPITSTVMQTIARDAGRVGATLTEALQFMMARNHQGFIIEAWARAQDPEMQRKLRRRLQEANNFADMDYSEGIDGFEVVN